MNNIDDPPSDPSSSGLVPAQLAQTPRSAPTVCVDHVWATSSGGASGAQLAVAVDDNHYRATIVALPASGELREFRLDGRMDMLGDPDGVPIALPGPFTQVAATLVDPSPIGAGHDAVVIGAVGGDGVELATIDDPANPTVTARLPGSMVAQPPVLTATDTRYVVTADDDTVWMTAIDTNLAPVKTFVLGYADNPITAIAAAQDGARAVIAYSTADACYVRSILAFNLPSTTHQLPYPCSSVSLAVFGGVQMAFEWDGGIATMSADDVVHAKPATVVSTGYAPRMAAADGESWVGYLTPSGGTEVGYDTPGARLNAISVDDEPGGNGVLPVISGNPWSISLDPIALAAHRLCP